MKRIDTYIDEGLIGGRTRAIKPVVEVMRDAFGRLAGPNPKEAGEELYSIIDTLPETKKYIRGEMIPKDYVQKNDPIIISFGMWNRHIASSLYLGRPKENTSIYIDLYNKKVHPRLSFENVTPIIYTKPDRFWISDSFDSWFIDKSAPSRDIFEEAMENLSK